MTTSRMKALGPIGTLHGLGYPQPKPRTKKPQPPVFIGQLFLTPGGVMVAKFDKTLGLGLHRVQRLSSRQERQLAAGIITSFLRRLM